MEVLSVLRQVFSGGRYRRIFGILPQIRLQLTSMSVDSWNQSRTLRTSNLSCVVTFRPISPGIAAGHWQNLQGKSQQSIFGLSNSCGKNMAESVNLAENSRCGSLRAQVADFLKKPESS